MMKLIPYLVLLALASPAIAGASIETRVAAPGWIVYAVDFADYGSAWITFGVESTTPLTDAATTLFIVPELPSVRYAYGILLTQGKGDVVSVTAGDDTGINVLGGPPVSAARDTAAWREIEMHGAVGRWYFVIVGGGAADGNAEVFSRFATTGVWKQRVGDEAHYVRGADDFGAAASVTASVHAQSAHSSAAGEYRFLTENRAFYVAYPGGDCVCRMSEPAESGDIPPAQPFPGDDLAGWNRGPGSRTLSYALSTAVRVDPTAHPAFGAHPGSVTLVAGDVSLPD